MPTLDTDAQFGLNDKRLGRGSSESVLADATEANYLDQAGLDTALAAADAVAFSAAKLSRMTKNDKVYALRKVQDAAGMHR